MLHNKEFKFFSYTYWIIFLVSEVTYTVICNHLLGDYFNRNITMKYIITGLVVMLIMSIIVFISSCIFFHRIYFRLNRLAAKMNVNSTYESLDISDEQDEGVISTLNSNYRKVVRALQESRIREKNEKEFLRDIISDISHQLKTPLASLTVFVDLLVENKITNEDERIKILVESEKQLGRMEWMVLSLLKLAKIESGSITFERKITDLKSILDRSIDTLSIRLEEKSIAINNSCLDNTLLMVDSEWLEEAFINIIKNAVDYTPVNGRINVEVEVRNVFIKIMIRDNGIGIAPEDVPHIFERFKKGSNNSDTNSVGIGLSLAKSIIEGQDGRISVSSRQGIGTCFTITFLTKV